MSDAVVPTLQAIVSDLVVVPSSPADALDEAHRAIAVAHLTGQQSGFSTRSSPIIPPPVLSDRTRVIEELLVQLHGTALPTQRVLRREFAARISPDPRIGAVPGGAEAPSTTLGPFLDIVDRPVVIDVFHVTTRIGVQRGGAAQPFLYVELPQPTGSGNELTLGPGSVWMPAAALAQNVPPSAFVGLRIKGGTLGFGTTIALGASPIVVPATATVTLSLTLDPAQPVAGTGPGADARAADVHTPGQVTFTFTGAAGRLSSAEDATFSAFGTDLKLRYHPLPAHFDPVFGRIDFPYTQERPDFAISVSHSSLARFAGRAAIFGAAWSLPLGIADPGSLGAASGAGGIAIGLLPGGAG
jgi:hypothetical protein